MKTPLTLSCISIVFTLVFLTGNVFALESEQQIKSIPHKLEIYNMPVDYVINDSKIKITAEEKTNLFNNPNGKSNVCNAPMVLFKPDTDFTSNGRFEGDI